MSKLDWHHLRILDGQHLWVLATEEEMAAYRDASPYKCEHPDTQLRDYPTSNGGWQRKEQCLTCGYATSNPEKRDKSIEVPRWDLELFARWESSCRERQQEIEDTLVERTASLEKSGYAFYEDYLQSDDWKKRRALVLKRDEGLCQCCLSEQATDVHHRTYDQIFNEYLFDLISVCRTCHERLHSRKIESIEAGRAKGLIE